MVVPCAVGGVGRVVAGLVAVVAFATGGVGLFLHVVFGSQGQTLPRWLAEAALGSLYFFGVALLGGLYAYRPFRWGLVILIFYATVPGIIAYVLWRAGIMSRCPSAGTPNEQSMPSGPDSAYSEP